MKKFMNTVKKTRKSLIFGNLVCFLVLMLAGCDFFSHDEKFDRSLMYGYWVTGTVHEFYDAAGTGYTWDTADDVTEEEAQPFTWTLENATLTQIHQMEMGGNVPKTYTVTKLTTTTLEYHDNYGKYYTFTKGK